MVNNTVLYVEGLLRTCMRAQSHLTITPWTVVCQAPLSMGFSRQEYWSGLPFPPPRDLADPGTKLLSSGISALVGDFLPLLHLGSPMSNI